MNRTLITFLHARADHECKSKEWIIATLILTGAASATAASAADVSLTRYFVL
jgi:hypothetical protein